MTVLVPALVLVLLLTVTGCSATDTSKGSDNNAGDTGDSSTPANAPDFAMKTLDGNTISLSDYAGRPIVLNFAASWCGSCEYEAPVRAKMYEKYKDRVTFLGVAVKDDEDSQRAFATKHGLTFPIGLDPGGDIVYSFQKTAKVSVHGIPTTFFINKEGYIETFWVGPLTETNFEKLVAQIID